MPNSRSSEIFSHNVRVLLRRERMTLLDLAEKSGTSIPGISRIINGKEGVTLDRAERIAIVFRLPLAAMLTEKFSEPVKQPA